METLLLGFCLISLTITGMIVVVELVRERKRFEKFSREESVRNELNSLASSEVDLEQADASTVKPQISQRVFDVLQQQLRIFGYRSEEQQMHFLNRLLETNYEKMSELSAQELRNVFAEIHRYKTNSAKSRSAASSEVLAQSA